MEAGTTTAKFSGSSILTALNSGSGIDTASLVSGLVDAQFAVKNQQFTAKADKLTSQISALSQLKSGITGFDAALRSLVKGGTLSTQPTSTNAAIKLNVLPGATVSSLSGTLTVSQLAGAQAATTNTPIDRTAAFRTGTLSLRFGTENASGSFTAGGAPAIAISIDSADTTLDGIAAKINAANTGVTANVVTDGGGARLTIKGATGAAQAFQLTGTDASGGALGGLGGGSSGISLSTLSIGGGASGTTIGTRAADAVVTLDGATYRRSGNSISDLVPGVRLDITETGTTTLGVSQPTSALSESVSNFVETFNQLQSVVKTDIDAATGVLKTDTAVNTMARSLGRLTTAVLVTDAPAGAPRTLADLGVTTNRDGTLSVDQGKLGRMLATQPQAVEKLFAYGTGKATDGVAGALGAITQTVTSRTFGLDASTASYNKAQTDLSDAQAKALDAAEAMRTRLTVQFAKMDAVVASYKSTQSFLKNQIDAWNKSGN